MKDMTAIQLHGKLEGCDLLISTGIGTRQDMTCCLVGNGMGSSAGCDLVFLKLYWKLWGCDLLFS
jgi:hypothetical protein